MKQSNKVSIIYTAYNPTKMIAQVSMATLANIRKYTEPEDYELIVIDSAPKFQMLDDYGALQLDRDGKYVVVEEDEGYCAAMNRGAKLAKYDYLCFIENDIFVVEDWLEDLRYYLDNELADVIVPDQIPRTREEILKFRDMSFEAAQTPGIQEQGMMMIRKEIFEKTGGWPEEFKKVYGWAAFKPRLTGVTKLISTTHKVQIGHIAGLTFFHDHGTRFKEFDKEMGEEAEALKKYR